MQFLSKELTLINVALQFRVHKNETGQDVLTPRSYPSLEDLKLALNIQDKIREFIEKKDEGSEIEKVFIDAEIDFGTEEKAFLLKTLNQPWTLEGGRIYVQLLEKLS